MLQSTCRVSSDVIDSFNEMGCSILPRDTALSTSIAANQTLLSAFIERNRLSKAEKNAVLNFVIYETSSITNKEDTAKAIIRLIAEGSQNELEMLGTQALLALGTLSSDPTSLQVIIKAIDEKSLNPIFEHNPGGKGMDAMVGLLYTCLKIVEHQQSVTATQMIGLIDNAIANNRDMRDLILEEYKIRLQSPQWEERRPEWLEVINALILTPPFREEKLETLKQVSAKIIINNGLNSTMWGISSACTGLYAGVISSFVLPQYASIGIGIIGSFAFWKASGYLRNKWAERVATRRRKTF